MQYQNPDDLKREQFNQVRAMKDAVTLFLGTHSPLGSAICRAIPGAPQRPHSFETGQSFACVSVVLPAAQVRQLLIRFAGKAGAMIAETLKEEGLDLRFVSVHDHEITLDAIKSGRKFYTQRVPLGESAGPAAGGTFEFEYPFDEGTVSAVVPTLRDGWAVLVLVHMSVTRTTLFGGGRRPPERLNDRKLASILREKFFNQSRNIARAIRTLRSQMSGKEAWLLRVLDERPELRGLARKVHHELAAE